MFLFICVLHVWMMMMVVVVVMMMMMICTAVCGAFFLYISTDYVFDGRNPPYGEDDSPNPLNVYGRSKLEGERETLRHCPGTCLSLPVSHLFVFSPVYVLTCLCSHLSVSQGQWCCGCRFCSGRWSRCRRAR